MHEGSGPLQTPVRRQGARALLARTPAGARGNTVALQFSLRGFCSLGKFYPTLNSSNGPSSPSP